MRPKRVNKKQLGPIVCRLVTVIEDMGDNYLTLNPPVPTWTRELCDIAADLDYLLNGE